MKVKHYDQMMAWLTRPGYANGERTVKNQYGTFKTTKLGLQKAPSTPELDAKAQKTHGKDFAELTIQERSQLKTGKFKSDTVTFEEYLDDYKKMAADPDYKPKHVKPQKGAGQSIQQRRARTVAKNTIQAFEEKVQRNVSKRKREKLKSALEKDPERKQKDFAKKAERRRTRRVEKLEGKAKLTPNEKLLNFEQSLITRQLNDKIKANPDIVLKDKKLMDQLSTTVSKDGDIIKIKPNLSDIKNRGIYEIEHQRDIRKAGAMKDYPYNRNLIMGPHNRTGGFKDAAEKFITKNPKSPKVDDILKMSEDLKVTLQPEVPKGIFKTKGLGYKQIGHPVEKFKSVAQATMPILVDNKIGMAGYTKNIEQMRRGLGVSQLNAKIPGLTRLIEEVAAIPEEFKAKKYWRVGLKGLGLAFTPLMVYDGYQAAKEGRPVAEVIERALIGTEGVYKAKEYFNMSPEAKAASSRINMQKMAEAGMQDPRVRGGGEFEADFIQEGDQDLILSEQDKYKMRRQQEDALRAQQRAAAIKMVHQRITGQPVYSMEFAGGGIAGIRRPGAVPPASGPMPQGGGLSSVFNRVKPW